MAPVTTLYRPVGPAELALIEAAGWRAFPPRLPEQPIFYPVLNEEYARQIARQWNVPACIHRRRTPSLDRPRLDIRYALDEATTSRRRRV